MKALWIFISAMLPVSVWAQASPSPGEAEAAAGCAACGGFILFCGILFVLNIALLIWVARDAKNRGMDSAILWMLLVMFTSVLGLLIYLFARPQGAVVQCPNCHNKKLLAA
jgi:ABC-type transport system involved in multi-copper enzyme maturation permease subunit